MSPIHSASLPLLQSLRPDPNILRNPKSPPTIPLVVSVRSLRSRCRSSSSPEGREPSRAEDVLSSMVEELLQREENRGLLDGLQEASRKVDRAREALADIERQEDEARLAKECIRRLEIRESELKIAESQRGLLEARTMVEEAERSLSLNIDENTLKEEIDKDMERIESIKAALVSSIIGTVASLPISLYQLNPNLDQLILHSIIIFISSALFGVTFRYTVRRDLDDVHLKSGTCAAFGFVKGLATVEGGGAVEPNVGSLISHSIDAAVNVSESIFIFIAASIALDFCFKIRVLSPFPIRK